MVLLTILFLVLAFLTIFTLLVVSIGGAASIIVFADVIVCGLVIFWIIKKLINRKKH